MRDRWRRLETMIARLRAGEGAHVLADLGESAERWLESGHPLVPRSLRAPLGQLGEVVGDLARALRPAPTDAPPPEGAPETFESEEPRGRYESEGALGPSPEPPRAEARPAATEGAALRVAHEAPPGRPEPRVPEAHVPEPVTGKGGAKKPAPKKPVRSSEKPHAGTTKKPQSESAKKKAAAKKKTSAPKKADAAKAGAKKPAGKKAKDEAGTTKSATARKNGKQAAKASPSSSAQTQPREPRRVSARRSTTGKRLRAGVVSEYPTPKKTNGKGREHRPAARRSRRDETDEPT